ncbi:hypothetical protein Ocin01_18014 [Orchesella cincta]|uniref:Uncharacterized protein n=1 Tax=Orchesella cincta TaxID=48709 RepID=A0A1D2M6T1_ORCCI|nr:hypothetical protein Ocin01_18014 [Orchesella cincta]
MHNLALPKSEVLKKEDTDVSSLYSLNSDGGEDVFIEEAPEATPKKKYHDLATALAAGNLTTTGTWEPATSVGQKRS